MEWQPIETAPKDGTKVILWCDGLEVGSYRTDDNYPNDEPLWLDESYDDFSDGFASVPLDPTHWQLPEPPRE